MTTPFTILPDGSLRLGDGTRVGSFHAAPDVVQFTSAQVNWNADTTVTLDATPSPGNVLVAIFGASNHAGQPVISWYAPSSGWNNVEGAGHNVEDGQLRRWIEWGMRVVQGGDTTTIHLGSFGDVTGPGSSNFDGACVAVYEVVNVDTSNMPASAIAGSVATYDPSSGNPTCGFVTAPVGISGGGLILAAAGYTGTSPEVGEAAIPHPAEIDVSLQNVALFVLGTYHVGGGGATQAVSEITGPVLNGGDLGTVELLVVLQGSKINPGTVGAVVAGTNVTIDNSQPTRPVVNVDPWSGRDSRISLRTGDTHTALIGGFTVDAWVTAGVDTAPFQYMNGDISRDLAGSDFTLADDGSGINVLTTCTIAVRFAFQMSALHGTQIAYIAPLTAVTSGSGFTGLISGDGDPLGVAVNSTDQDLIGTYLWRVQAGSFLQFAVTIAGNTADEQTDGFEIDVVRIA